MQFCFTLHQDFMLTWQPLTSPVIGGSPPKALIISTCYLVNTSFTDGLVCVKARTVFAGFLYNMHQMDRYEIEERMCQLRLRLDACINDYITTVSLYPQWFL